MQFKFLFENIANALKASHAEQILLIKSQHYSLFELRFQSNSCIFSFFRQFSGLTTTAFTMIYRKVFGRRTTTFSHCIKTWLYEHNIIMTINFDENLKNSQRKALFMLELLEFAAS